MKQALSLALWLAIGAIGVASVAWIALRRGETVSAAWLLTAAVCTYMIAFRLYSRFIATRTFALEPDRATPALRPHDTRCGHPRGSVHAPGPGEAHLCAARPRVVVVCVGTTIIIRMDKARYAWVTLTPLAWLVVVTMSAGWAKLFASDPRLGFLANARFLSDAIATNTLPPNIASVAMARQMVFNNYIAAAVAAFFMIAVVVILADSMRTWLGVLQRRVPMASTEVPAQSRAGW